MRVDTACPSGDHIKPENKPGWLTPRADYIPNIKHYQRYCMELDFIPSDIPQDVKEVRFYGNPLKTLRANDFRNLSDCTLMDLAFNEINTLSIGSFNGLTALQMLNLFENKLTQITSGVFVGLPALWRLDVDANAINDVQPQALDLSELPALRQLTLHDNALTTLRRNVFGDVTPKRTLELILSENPMICNVSLCWIKQAERGTTEEDGGTKQDGWLTWWDGDNNAPECSNYPNTTWSSINLNCSDHGKTIIYLIL